MQHTRATSGERCRLEANRNTDDYVGAVACRRGLCDAADGLVGIVRVILRELEERERVAQPNCRNVRKTEVSDVASAMQTAAGPRTDATASELPPSVRVFGRVEQPA